VTVKRRRPGCAVQIGLHTPYWSPGAKALPMG
jgi:hypothetical protein